MAELPVLRIARLVRRNTPESKIWHGDLSLEDALYTVRRSSDRTNESRAFRLSLEARIDRNEDAVVGVVFTPNHLFETELLLAQS
jgi:hypothetical protein